MHIDEPRVCFRAEFRDFRNFINNILFLLLSSIFLSNAIRLHTYFLSPKFVLLELR